MYFSNINNVVKNGFSETLYYLKYNSRNYTLHKLIEIIIKYRERIKSNIIHITTIKIITKNRIRKILKYEPRCGVEQFQNGEMTHREFIAHN